MGCPSLPICEPKQCHVTTSKWIGPSTIPSAELATRDFLVGLHFLVRPQRRCRDLYLIRVVHTHQRHPHHHDATMLQSGIMHSWKKNTHVLLLFHAQHLVNFKRKPFQKCRLFKDYILWSNYYLRLILFTMNNLVISLFVDSVVRS